MEARYGWTEEYILDELPYARFLKKAEIVAERKKDEYMREKERDLFNAWLRHQENAYIKQDDKLNFYQYVKELGFEDIAEKYIKLRNKGIDEDKKKAKQNVNDVIDFVNKKEEKQG